MQSGQPALASRVKLTGLRFQTHPMNPVAALNRPSCHSRLVVVAMAAAASVLVAGCASPGPNSADARPVLYPNATFNRLGEAQAQAEVKACLSRASASGLSPTQSSNEVGRRAGEGAATAGVASAIGALITGRGGEGVLRAGAAGAAVGGSAGAVSGAFHNDRPNPVYRNFVQRCVAEKGLELIGWN